MGELQKELDESRIAPVLLIRRESAALFSSIKIN